MIYVDASVVLADLFAEDRRPLPAFWQETLVSSRLLQYEAWTTINRLGVADSHTEVAHHRLGLVSLIELSPLALDRALEPFPVPVRTLDALHLSSMWYMRQQGDPLVVATYDKRLARAAEAMGLSLYDLDTA